MWARAWYTAALLIVSSNAAADPPSVPHPDFRARWGFLFVPTNPADGCPVERADAPLAQLQAVCANLDKTARASKARRDRSAYAATAKQCVEKYTELYVPLLQQRYSRADFADVVKQIEELRDPTRLECLLATSHNLHLDAEIDREQAEWDAAERQLADSSARSDAMRRRALQPAKPRAESKGRLALQALALALQGMGAAWQGNAPPSPRTAPSARALGSIGAERIETEQPACSSDFECEYGSSCVKAPLAMTGYCARQVDALGVSTFAPPSPKSVMPGGQGQCAFDTDCPVGFRCAVEPGALRGACLQRH